MTDPLQEEAGVAGIPFKRRDRVNEPDPLQELVKVAWGERRVPHDLAHYTRLDALDYLLPRRIVPPTTPVGRQFEDFELQATSVRFMNDPDEFLFGRRALSRMLSRESVPDARELGALLAEEDEPVGYETYAVCFSERLDDLSQWRGYGDDGRGLCFVYSWEDIEKTQGGVGRTTLAPVTYGTAGRLTDTAPDSLPVEDPVSGLIQNWIRQEALWRSIRHPEITELDPKKRSVQEYINTLYEQRTKRYRLDLASVLFKDSAFEDESEHRLITFGPSSGVRLTGRKPRPFRTIPFDDPLIPQKIILGPQISDPGSVYAVRERVALINRALGGPCISVEPSAIGYRPIENR